MHFVNVSMVIYVRDGLGQLIAYGPEYAIRNT